MLRKWVGTAFGTARFIEFALSADDALLFRSAGPIHHRRHAKSKPLIQKHFFLSINLLGGVVCTLFWDHPHCRRDGNSPRRDLSNRMV